MLERIVKEILEEQRSYYEAHADEYDRDLRARRLSPRMEVLDFLSNLPADFDALELGCGTGFWTHVLAARFRRVTAVDSSARMLAIHRKRVAAKNVRRLQRDVFSWHPAKSYNLVFFGFLLAHVPLALFAEFWRSVGSALRTGGCVVFVDELDNPEARAFEERLSEADAISVRTLENGRRFRIIKVFWQPSALKRELEHLGWRATIRKSGHFYCCRAEPAT